MKKFTFTLTAFALVTQIFFASSLSADEETAYSEAIKGTGKSKVDRCTQEWKKGWFGKYGWKEVCKSNAETAAAAYQKAIEDAKTDVLKKCEALSKTGEHRGKNWLVKESFMDKWDRTGPLPGCDQEDDVQMMGRARCSATVTARCYILERDPRMAEKHEDIASPKQTSNPERAIPTDADQPAAEPAKEARPAVVTIAI